MLIALLYQLVRCLTDLALVRTQSDAQLRAEVLAPRHQLRLLERKVGKPVWQPADRLLLAALSRLLRRSSLDALLPRPETLLRWHRELVRRKWAAFAGRPPRPRSTRHRERRELVLRLAQENPSWGYRRIQGEALKLGFKISHMGVAKILRRQRIPPGPRRAGHRTWREFVRQPQGPSRRRHRPPLRPVGGPAGPQPGLEVAGRHRQSQGRQAPDAESGR